MSFFDMDSPFMAALSRIADLIVLNIAVLICCIPVFTIGAAMTGMHYVLVKMARDEDSHILRSYFKSFKENFRQAAAIWCLFLFLGLILTLDIFLIGGRGGSGITFPVFLRYMIIGGGVLLLMVYLYVFPLLARFHNTVPATIANAARLAAASFPRTIAMLVVTLAVPAAFWLVPALFPLFIFLGLTGPGYLCSLLYYPVIKKIEEKAADLSV